MGTPIRKLLLLTISVCFLCVTGCRKPSDLGGTWVYQPHYQEEGMDVGDRWLPKGTLTLKDDGAFTFHFENRAMVEVIMNVRGRYKRSGDTLTLTGTSKGYSNDGYHKGAFREPWTMKLRYADGALTEPDDPTKALVFRRKGAKPPPEPKPRLVPSDPKAVKIVREMVRRYAALTTYSDEGTFTSSGTGFMAENARFQTRFARPHTFRFRVAKVAGGKEWEYGEVRATGPDSYYTRGEMGGGSLGNALATISPFYDGATMLVPSLLLPDEFGGSPPIDTSSGGLSLAGEETVSGANCHVIRVSDPEGFAEKYWIDKTSYLILRVFDEQYKATITYHPKRNIAILKSEFEFSSPKGMDGGT